MNGIEQITNAEWEVMRIIWTLNHATSRQVTIILNKKENWQASTVKTLLRRLTKKKCLSFTKKGRSNIYYPRVDEQTAADSTVFNLFKRICAMHAGRTLEKVIDDVPISKSNIDMLIDTLEKKRLTAPDKVPCNCLENCDEEMGMKQDE